MKTLTRTLVCFLALGISTAAMPHAVKAGSPIVEAINGWNLYGKFTSSCLAREKSQKLRELGFQTRILVSHCKTYFIVEYRH